MVKFKIPLTQIVVLLNNGEKSVTEAAEGDKGVTKTVTDNDVTEAEMIVFIICNPKTVLLRL